MDAVKYAQQHFRKFLQPENVENPAHFFEQVTLIQQVMGLIALLPHKRQMDPKFLYFVNIQRWHELKELYE